MSGSTFVYPLETGLYINLTNKCSNSCTFCIREGADMDGLDLWLTKEPSAAEVIQQLELYPDFNDVIFCGYGEPTFRLEVLLEVAKYLKSQNKTVRLNTNGLGSAINKRDITPELAQCIDIISVSLNAADKESYDKISRPTIEDSFEKIVQFATNSAKNGISTILTAVDIIDSKAIEHCKALAKTIGAAFRLRSLIPTDNPAKTPLG